MRFLKKYNWIGEKMWVERQLADSDFANCFNVCGCVFELSEMGTCLWVATPPQAGVKPIFSVTRKFDPRSCP